MHTAAHHGLRSASRHKLGHICRCGHPYRVSRRPFSQTNSPRLNLNPWSSGSKAHPAEQPTEQERSRVVPPAEQHHAAEEVAEAKEAEASTETGSAGRDRNIAHTAVARRGARNRRPKELPQPIIPKWFFNNNIKLHEDERPFVEGVLQIIPRNEAGKRGAESPLSGKVEEQNAQPDVSSTQQLGNVPKEEIIYRLDEAIMDEVAATISAGLSSVQTDNSNSFPGAKSHVRLHCPVDNCDYMLEKIVDTAASKLGADIIRLDAQDIAEIAGDYIKEGRDSTSNALWTLGYDTMQHGAQGTFEDPERDQDEQNEEAEDEGADQDGMEISGRHPFSSMTAIPMISIERSSGSLDDLVKSMANFRDKFSKGAGHSLPRNNGRNNGTAFATFGTQPNPSQQWNDLKLSTLLEVLLETNQTKRSNPSLQDRSGPSSGGIGISYHDSSSILEPSNDTTQTQPPTSDLQSLPRTVILLRGFKELCTTQQGSFVLDKLLDIVEKKRKQDGQHIIIVGATSSSVLTPELSRRGIEGLQAENQDSVYRTVVVTPHEADVDEGAFVAARYHRIREINMRNLRDMARRLAPTTSNELFELLDPGKRGAALGDHDVESLERITTRNSLMDFDEVHRAMLTATGMVTTGENLQLKHIVAAMDALKESDQAKSNWIDRFHEQRGARTSGAFPVQVEGAHSERATPTANDRRLKHLQKTCNSHEKVMLRGVVNSENIRTTFNDVHAPPETIEALRTMTMLSLTRPEAFKYGVLATDKLSGCLLYGPPGTGKTLLAKAVAKESGATVLEVSGSDVYDMYVGEAEKNVRAIFTLARKLSPCVVFIDEADAIFATRGSNQRNTHRELINQFLREWDGMTETNAFLMLATNRPFDLDDAALRRLPRRLLVDLPVEKDREAILRIHLKDEQLEPSVSILNLAQRTPLYSGSDLKNLAVAAALAAVREENEDAEKHTGEEPYMYPEQRVLAPRHFDKALEEITASVGEDMSSLSAIKKFDEKYGDRRGKKKRSVYGFAGAQSITEETNKVRA